MGAALAALSPSCVLDAFLQMDNDSSDHEAGMEELRLWPDSPSCLPSSELIGLNTTPLIALLHAKFMHWR